MDGREPLNRYGGEYTWAWSRDGVGSPPVVSTRPSGRSNAVEWYMRGSDMASTVRHVSVGGSKISAGSTAADALSPLPVPPTARLVPSASMVRFRRRRG